MINNTHSCANAYTINRLLKGEVRPGSLHKLACT